MVVLGFEIYKFSQLPMEVKEQFESAQIKPNSFVIKKIVQKSPLRVEWEVLEGKPSDWLMKDFPE